VFNPMSSIRVISSAICNGLKFLEQDRVASPSFHQFGIIAAHSFIGVA
jgi:hypothetical protein